MYLTKRTLKLVLLSNLNKIASIVKYLKLKSKRPSLTEDQKKIIEQRFKQNKLAGKHNGKYKIFIEEADWTWNDRKFCRCPDQGLIKVNIVAEYYPGYKIIIARWIVCKSCLNHSVLPKEGPEAED